MKYGLLLPTSDLHSIEEESFLLSSIDNSNIDSIWIRDVPMAQLGDLDEGSRIDPFQFINYLSTITQKAIGIAVLNTSLRSVEVTVREVLSSQFFNNNQLYFGVGAGGKEALARASNLDYENKNIYFSHWLSRYKKYFDNQKTNISTNEDLVINWEGDFEIPKLTVATTDKGLLKDYNDIIDRNIIWFQKRNIIEDLAQSFENIELNMFLSIMPVKNVSHFEFVSNGGRKLLKTDLDSFKQLAHDYESLGVRRLILAVDGTDSMIEFINKI